ncbi:hypothetical protein KJ359_003915 [Pestalotiopsis sp. 9143b]|nr:hypothetical protein KJ359_003915 [Pestalotiopsis sp. 9143b]
MLYNSSDTDDDWWGQITNNTETTGWLFGYDEDVSWTLDAFDGDAASVAVFVSSNLTENVFYIGTDTSLHGVSGYNTSWDKSTTQDNEKWPLADDASAPLALAYDSASDRVWIYYMSNGNLTQVYRSDADTWEDSITLSKSVNVTETATSDAGSTGLSTSGKIGVGVGVGAGAIVFAGIAFVFFWQRRARQNQGVDPDTPDPSGKDPSNPAAGPLLSPLSVPGSPAPAYLSGYWVNGQWVPPQTEQPYSYYDHTKPENRIAHEMWAPPPGVQPMYELPHEERTHEMPIDGHQVAEMPTEVQSTSPQDPAAPSAGAQQSSGSHLTAHQQHVHEPDAAKMQHARFSAITPEPTR